MKATIFVLSFFLYLFFLTASAADKTETPWVHNGVGILSHDRGPGER